MQLCLRFCESEIEYWAERYCLCQKLSSREWEQDLIKRKDSIQKYEEMCTAIENLDHTPNQDRATIPIS